MELRRYITEGGRDLIGEWLASIRDPHARAAVAIRLTRLAEGNSGDSKSVGDGVLELRIDVGQGYRLYYARIGRAVILLLCGGDKRRQRNDIERAKSLLGDHRRRSCLE
ncbi:MAG: type II toxin-antitoxin system RelE/ParE family toxin [Planctomycetaceae bacterium]|nr:type II toxin-antitoxin system RelE/ParE family toxin [Planctomycetaceae bacterium]